MCCHRHLIGSFQALVVLTLCLCLMFALCVSDVQWFAAGFALFLFCVGPCTFPVLCVCLVFYLCCIVPKMKKLRPLCARISCIWFEVQTAGLPRVWHIAGVSGQESSHSVYTYFSFRAFSAVHIFFLNAIDWHPHYFLKSPSSVFFPFFNCCAFLNYCVLYFRPILLFPYQVMYILRSI